MHRTPRTLILAAALALSGLVGARAQISIMPLGDSITWGFDGLVDTPQYLADLDTGGYRSPLYSLLTSANLNFNFVGVDNGNPSPLLTAAGQTAHNGFNGYTIDDLDGNLTGTASSADGVSNDGGYWLNGGHGTGRSAFDSRRHSSADWHQRHPPRLRPYL